MIIPDITTVVPSKSGEPVSIFNLFIVDPPRGIDDWNWDAMGRLYIKDDDCPEFPGFVLVSLAVKGFGLMVGSKLNRGHVVNVSGTWGKLETSNSGREKFRRIFCELSDIEVVRVIEQ